MYMRSKHRDGCHVLVRYHDVAGDEEWVGVIERFVSITLKSNAGLRPLRIALVNFYQRKPAIDDADIGKVYRVDLVPARPWHDKEYPVLLDSIDDKLAYTSRTTEEAGQQITERLLSKYIMYSGSYKDSP